MRIFLGLAEVAGNYVHLERGLRALGVDCVHVDLFGESARYAKLPKSNPALRFVEWTGVARRTSKNRWAKAAIILLQAVLRVPLFFWAVARFDTFIFGFGATFFNTRELPLLRALGKRVVFQFHGSDVRPPYLDGALMTPPLEGDTERCLRLTHASRRLVERAEKHSDIRIAAVTIAHFFARPFVDVLILGKPFAPPKSAVVVAAAHERVRILHAPSDLDAKGTHEIRAAVEKLKTEGLALDYVEIHGRPPAEVIAAIERCDFVIDQLYSDIYMSSFAKEAAFLGKPAIVGGRFDGCYARAVFDGCRPPIAYCEPDGLAAAIRTLALDHDHRQRLGAAAYDFVTRRWDEVEVAKRYVALLGGEASTRAWQLDPAGVDYVHGVALSEERARRLIRAVVAKGGATALELDHKPELRAKVLGFAQVVQ